MLNWPSYIAQHHLPKDDATNSGFGGGGGKASFILSQMLTKKVCDNAS